MKNFLSCLTLVLAGLTIFLGGIVLPGAEAHAQQQADTPTAGSAAPSESDLPSLGDSGASNVMLDQGTAPTAANGKQPAADPATVVDVGTPKNKGAPPSLADSLSTLTPQPVAKKSGSVGSGSPMPPAPSDGATASSQGLDLGGVGFDDPNATPKKSDQQIENELREKAFKAATERTMPMKPGEIRRLLEIYDETVQATETPIYPDPEPISSFTRASLEPGAKPVVIKTAVGNVTTVSIVDISGQPWPIQDMTWAGNFQVDQPDVGSHMLRITPTSKFATGNISMRLVGLNPPVIFTLRTERKTVHVRLDVQIPEMGPRGVTPPVDTPIGTKAGNEDMTGVLMGVVNKGTTDRMKVEGVDGRTTAYSQGDMVYVRTPYTLLSPAWSQSVQSADGTKVYALNYTPVILLSDKGKMVRATLSRKEQADDQY